MQQSYIDRMEEAYQHKKYFIDIIKAIQKKDCSDNLLEKVFEPNRVSSFNILDYGCGSGLLAYKMAQAFPHAKITGYDKSLEMIEIARERFVLPNLYFTSTENTLQKHFFDFVILSSVLHEVYSPAAEILDVSTFLDNMTQFVNSRGYIISRDNYVQPGEAQNVEIKFIDYCAADAATEFAKKIYPLMPRSLNIAGNWNIIFNRLAQNVTGPDRTIKEFLNKLTWGEESLHREAKEMLFFLSPETWEKIVPKDYEIVSFYNYTDQTYLDYLKRYIILDEPFFTHRWTILRKKNIK